MTRLQEVPIEVNGDAQIKSGQSMGPTNQMPLNLSYSSAISL